MSVQIVTGYTGERHITPYMDAAVNRSIFGEDGCILATGNQMSASMPTINSFVIADGAFSIQGHIGVTNGETLAVDTCATGSNRIDLVVARFTHNATTLIDGLEIVLVKGEETTSAYPTTPTINTGVIASGATTVDMALYKINLSGSTVTFSRQAKLSRFGLGDISDPVGGQWVKARDNAGFKVIGNNTSNAWVPAIDVKSANYDFSIGAFNDRFYISAVSDTQYGANTNSPTQVYFDPANKVLMLDGMQIGKNRYLNTPNAYMSGSQDISLSQRISAQATGIVLVWCAFVNGEVKDYDYDYQFIPKWHVQYNNGKGVCFHMATNGFEKIGSKYVYVYDNHIKGHANNTASGTRNGITYANNYWVLHAVIGV